MILILLSIMILCTTIYTSLLVTTKKQKKIIKTETKEIPLILKNGIYYIESNEEIPVSGGYFSQKSRKKIIETNGKIKTSAKLIRVGVRIVNLLDQEITVNSIKMTGERAGDLISLGSCDPIIMPKTDNFVYSYFLPEEYVGGQNPIFYLKYSDKKGDWEIDSNFNHK